MKKTQNFSDIRWIVALFVIFVISFSYVFDSKLNLNGDNCYYFANATSLAKGDGYADMFGNPTNNFPPGYPLLMMPLRMVTDSIVAQKILNGVFLFAGVVLLFLTATRVGIEKKLSFLACTAVLLTPHILEFSVMMMSEAACFCCLSLIFLLYRRVTEKEKTTPFYRIPEFYLFLVLLVFSYYIRTQAIAVIVGFALAFVAARRFGMAVSVVVAFAAGYAPWMLRNSLLGLNQSRYVSQIDVTNILSTVKMLVVQAMPESIIPFIPVNYEQTPGIGLWIVSLLILALILYGFWNMGKLRLPLFFYFCGTIGIISLFNVPSQYRYLITIIPFLTLGLFVGIQHLCDRISLRLLNKHFSSWILVVMFLPLMAQGDTGGKHTLADLHETASQKFPPQYNNFFALGKALAKRDADAIVCSRKPELLYATSGMRGVHYLESKDDAAMIRNMLDRKVDYVLLEQLGFISTYNFLYPCIQKHPELFKIVARLSAPDTFLFRFDKDEAEKWLNGLDKQ